MRVTKSKVYGPAVYRLYGPQRRLIYVGYSGNVMGRLAHHLTTNWNPKYRAFDWESADWEMFPTIQEAAAEEERLIKTLLPPRNHAGITYHYQPPPGSVTPVVSGVSDILEEVA